MSLWYALVELLPFSWAAADGLTFMKHALLAILVAAPLFGLLSTLVVSSRMSFFSDALGHSAFTGVAVGVLFGLTEPLWCAVALAAAFALLCTFVRHRTSLPSDTVIGVFSSTAVALGIFIATLGGRSFTKFNALLIGDILSVEPSRIGLLAGIFLAVAALWLVSYNRLLLVSAHPELARSRGVHAGREEAVFSVTVAVVVTLSMTWVGLLVINSLLVLPAAAARNLARNTRQYHALSLALATCSGVAGLLISYELGASAGACVTLCLAALFTLSFLARRRAD